VILNTAATDAPNLEISQRLAGHASIANPKIYTQLPILAANL